MYKLSNEIERIGSRSKLPLLLAATLSILFCAGVIVISDEASASDFTDYGDCGNNGGNVKWYYQESKHLLTIDGTGEMRSYDADDPPWYKYREKIKFITIDDGVEALGEYAFTGCMYVERVEFPATLSRVTGESFHGYGLNGRPASELAGKTFVSKQGLFFQEDMVALLITEPDDYGHGAVTVRTGDEILYGLIDGRNTGTAFFASIGSTHYYAKSLPQDSVITVSGSKYGYELTGARANGTPIENGSFILTEDTTITYDLRPVDFTLKVDGVDIVYSMANFHRTLMPRITDAWGVERLRYDEAAQSFFIGDREIPMGSAVVYDGLAFLMNIEDCEESSVYNAWAVFDSGENIFYKLMNAKVSLPALDDSFVYYVFSFVFKGTEAPEGANMTVTEESGGKVHTIDGSFIVDIGPTPIMVEVDVVLTLKENDGTFMITGNASAGEALMSLSITFVQDRYLPISANVPVLMNGYLDTHGITSEPGLIEEEVWYDPIESGTRKGLWYADTAGATVTDLGTVSYNSPRFGELECTKILYETQGSMTTTVIKYFHEGELVGMEVEASTATGQKRITYEYIDPAEIHSKIFGDIECEVVQKTEIDPALAKPTSSTRYYIYNGLTVREETYGPSGKLKSLGTLDDMVHLPFFAKDGYELVTKHVVTFRNHDGAVLQSGKADYASTPEYSGPVPTRDPTAQYAYSFTGWSPAVGPVTGAAEYTAVFETVPRPYAVTIGLDGGAMDAPEGWVATEDGYTRSFPYGTPWSNVLDSIGGTPEKKGHAFKGWADTETGGEVASSHVIGRDTAVRAVWEMKSPNPGPEPTPTPKPKPQVITVNVSFKPTTGGKISMDSAKIPLNAKVTVNGDTLIIGSGSSKTIVKAEPFNGFVFDSWSIEDGNILTDGNIVAKFRAIALAAITVDAAPVKTEYKEGEKFDPTGLIIIAGFDDMSSMTMGYDGNKGLFTFSPSLDAPLSSEDTKVTVYYNGQSTDISITVASDPEDGAMVYAAITVIAAIAAAAAAAVFFLLRKPI